MKHLLPAAQAAAGLSARAASFVQARAAGGSRPVLVCLSHLRWDFVYQRPQHIMSRLAEHWDILYVEEPLPTDGRPGLDERSVAPGVSVVVPRLPPAECAPADPAGEARVGAMLRTLLEERSADAAGGIVVWCQTPMAVVHVDALRPRLLVYDCMDELRNFRYAPPELIAREAQLLERADLLFTGGHSIHEAKRHRHSHAHLFPSSVDLAHFAAARRLQDDPPDTAALPHPRIGYYGVIDERIDLELIAEAVQRRPDWQWVMLGPLAKIDAAALPRAPNLHYLGAKRYEELPAYLAHWDAAMMPFALNDSTRYISPTKTPEYLAGGCAVASTPIADVVHDWGESGLIHIGNGAAAFVDAVAEALAHGARSERLCAAADRQLAGRSWQKTVAAMTALIREALVTQPAAIGHAASRVCV